MLGYGLRLQPIFKNLSQTMVKFAIRDVLFFKYI
jgi:hypothetical protein